MRRDAKLPILAFEAHMDTVGFEGMTIPPLTPEVRDGRMYGRGTADTKGSMAAMLVALDQLRTADLPLNLMFIGSCAEETGCEGVPLLDLSPWPVSGIIVGEPTSNQPVVAHKAHVWFDLVCTGRAAHGSRPDAGVNAIYRMTDVIQWLRAEFIPELAGHVAEGFAGSTLSVDIIQGGHKVNIVPDRCSISVDVRLVPTAPREDEMLKSLTARIRTATGVDVTVANVHSSPGLSIDRGSPLVRALCGAIELHGDIPDVGAVSYCTDAGVFDRQGYPAVVFGPGSILQAHAAEEFIALAELHRAVDILTAAARRFATG